MTLPAAPIEFTYPWPLWKLISGGQTGADISGLIVAETLGYATGGTMPAGCMTEDGAKPEWARHFGLNIHGSYTERTRENVLACDGTIIFGDASEPGSALTLKLCRVLKKRFMVVEFYPGVLVPPGGPEPLAIDDLAQAIREWVMARQIKVLNIAGNRESTNPGIGARVQAVLLLALKRPE